MTQAEQEAVAVAERLAGRRFPAAAVWRPVPTGDSGNKPGMSALHGPAGAQSVDLPLDQGDQAPGQARRGAREVLLAWQLPGLVDSVVLVVSELVTNAVRYGRPTVSLVLHRSAQLLRVDVHDGHPDGPATDRNPATELDESGRGLAITQALASHVGWTPAPGVGKVVSASFDLQAQDGPVDELPPGAGRGRHKTAAGGPGLL